MGATTFDPLRVTKDLEAVGIERKHAEALAAAMREAATAVDHATLPTKADLAELRGELYRALWAQGGAIVTAHVAIAAVLFGLLLQASGRPLA